MPRGRGAGRRRAADNDLHTAATALGLGAPVMLDHARRHVRAARARHGFRAARLRPHGQNGLVQGARQRPCAAAQHRRARTFDTVVAIYDTANTPTETNRMACNDNAGGSSSRRPRQAPTRPRQHVPGTGRRLRPWPTAASAWTPARGSGRCASPPRESRARINDDPAGGARRFPPASDRRDQRRRHRRGRLNGHRLRSDDLVQMDRARRGDAHVRRERHAGQPGDERHTGLRRRGARLQ